jgi:hypothetical protein
VRIAFDTLRPNVSVFVRKGEKDELKSAAYPFESLPIIKEG